MKRKYINDEVENQLAVVTINNPPVNSLGMDVIGEIVDVIKELNAREDVGVIIITGAGQKAFVAGADIRMFKDMFGNREAAFEGSRRMQMCFNAIEYTDKVVIAAINGLALGGGCELAAACDIRIVEKKALIGVPEVRLGLIPGAGGTQRLSRLMGKGKAKWMVLGGDFFTAEDALKMGFVEKVVPDGEALAESKKIARGILGNAPLAIRNGKKAINEGLNMSFEEGLIREAELMSDLFMTEDLREGAAAFLEKRLPKFKGR